MLPNTCKATGAENETLPKQVQPLGAEDAADTVAAWQGRQAGLSKEAERYRGADGPHMSALACPRKGSWRGRAEMTWTWRVRMHAEAG